MASSTPNAATAFANDDAAGDDARVVDYDWDCSCCCCLSRQRVFENRLDSVDWLSVIAVVAQAPIHPINRRGRPRYLLYIVPAVDRTRSYSPVAATPA